MALLFTLCLVVKFAQTDRERSIFMSKAGSRLACSRRSDSRARGKNSRRKKKRGETSREKGEGGGEEREGGRVLLLSPLSLFLTRSPLTAALYYLNVWNRLDHASLNDCRAPCRGLPRGKFINLNAS